MIIINATDGLADWLRDRKNRRGIPHRLERCGYIPVRNDDAADGLFKVKGRRQTVYGRADLSIRDRHEAAAGLVEGDGGGLVSVVSESQSFSLTPK